MKLLEIVSELVMQEVVSQSRLESGASLYIIACQYWSIGAIWLKKEHTGYQ